MSLHTGSCRASICFKPLHWNTKTEVTKMPFEIQRDGQLASAAEGDTAVTSCIRVERCISKPGNVFMPSLAVEMSCVNHEPLSTSLAQSSPVWSLWPSTKENPIYVATPRCLAALLASLLLFLLLKQHGGPAWVKGKADCRADIFIATVDAEREKAIADLIWLIRCSAHWAPSSFHVLWDELPKLNISKCWDYETLIIKSWAISNPWIRASRSKVCSLLAHMMLTCTCYQRS